MCGKNEHILKILYKNNIKIFEKLFVSCERVTKWDDGKLFFKVYRKKKRLNKKVLCI